MVNFHRITPAGDYYTNAAVIDEVALSTTNSVYFNNTPLSVPTAAMLLGTGDFTVECWAYMSSYNPSGNGGTVLIDNWVGTSAEWQLWIQSSGFLRFDCFTSATQTAASTATVPLNQWNHLAAVRSGSTIKVYINGVTSGTPLTFSGNVGANLGTSSLGKQSTGSTYFYSGYMSNVRLVAGTALYTANFTVPSAPLTAVSGTKLLTCQSSTIVDNSTNGYTITNSSGATVDYSQASFYRSSFNGSSQYLTTATASISSYDFSNGNYTIEFWMNPSTITTETAILCAGPATSGALNRGWGLELHNGTSAGLWFYQAGVITSWTNLGSYTANVWQHVAIVRNGTTVTAYVNGTSVGSASSGTSTQTAFSAGDIFFIGALYNTGNVGRFFYNGSMTNLRIIKGTALYTSNFIPQTTILESISSTSLLTLQSPTIVDNSPNAYTITNNGTMTVQSPISTVDNRISSDGTFYTTLFDEVSLGTPYSVKFSSQYLTVPASTAFAFGTGDFTIEFWVYLTTTTGTRVLTNRRPPGGQAGTWSVSFGDTYLNFTEVIVGEPGISSSFSSIVNTWTHFAVCRVSGQTTIYKNGSSIATGSQTTNFSDSSYSLYIAANPILDSYIPGYLSNIRIVKGTGLYRSNFTTPGIPLTNVPGTSLLTCQSSTIIDNSTNAFTISNPNSATVTSEIPMYSASFNGTSQYLSIASNTPLTFGTSSFTIEFWINVTAAPVSFATIYDSRPASTQGVYTLLYLNSDRTMRFFVSSADRITSSALNLNTWYHVALVKNSSVTTMYLNGTATGSTYSDTNSYLASATNIGAGYAAGASITTFFSGYLSNLRVVKGNALYTSNFQPYGQLLPVINTSLLTLQSPTIIDNSINAFTITNNGATVRAPLTTVTKRQWSNGALQIVGQFDDYSSIYETRGSTYSGLFNSTSDNLTIVTNTASQTALVFGTSDFTLEAWIRPTSITTGAMIYDCRTTYPTLNGFCLFVYGTLVTLGTNGNTFYNNAAGVAPLNTWTHVALVKISGVFYCYVNGLLAFSQSYATTLTDNATFYIGRTTDFNTAYQFNGYISNLRIVKGTGLYTSNFTPSTTQLTAISGSGYSTSLLTLQGSTAVDNSGNGLTITNNNVDFTADVAPF